MGSGRFFKTIVPFLLLLVIIIPFASGWGFDGHTVICRIAQARLSEVALDAVRNLLPDSANDLGVLCPWADRVKFRYRWSSDLHFINTPDNLCSYRNARDCKDRKGTKGRCLEGAINNYTTQLLSYRDNTHRYNLTEALLFLSHFIGDIHQPLHVGFTSDKGGNTINVTWFTRKQVLHHVWDTDLIQKFGKGRGNVSNIDDLTKNIQQKINSQWGKQVTGWEACCCLQKTCPNVYAAESINKACKWAYKGVYPGSILKENYFETRLPIVEQRLAQAGIRLAATLNRIFI